MPYYAGDPGFWSKVKGAAAAVGKGAVALASNPMVQGLVMQAVPGLQPALSLAGGFLRGGEAPAAAVAGGTPGMLAAVGGGRVRVRRSRRRRRY